MTSIRKSIVRGIILNLHPLRNEHDEGYFKLITPYHGPLTPDRENQEWQRISQGIMPVCAVRLGRGEYQDRTMGGRVADKEIAIHLLIGSNNLRSGEERELGDDGLSGDPGIFQMQEDILDRLYNRPLEGAIGACTARPLDEDEVLLTNDRTIWVLNYTIKTDAIVPRLDEEDRPLLGITSKLGFSQTEEPGAPDDVTEFDSVSSP